MLVGYNNFEVEAFKKRNVIGINAPGVLDETVADLVFALILSSARRISEFDRFVKEGKCSTIDPVNGHWTFTPEGILAFYRLL